MDGSVGRNDPLPHSDIDLLVITKGGRKPDWFSYFDCGIHVTVGFKTLREYRDSDFHHRYFFWTRGGAISAKVIYDPMAILGRAVRERRAAKAAPRLVEAIAWRSYRDIVEYVGKLRNGWMEGDEYLTRHAAREIAVNAQEVMLALNDISPISENTVWHQVMEARKRPKHFSTDYPISLGLKGVESTRRIFLSAMRLAGETLALIRCEESPMAKNRRFRAFMAKPLDRFGLE